MTVLIEPGHPDWDQLITASKVAARIMRQIQQTEQCWHWTGYVNPRTGYGQVWHAGTNRLAHRVVYALVYGDIPAGVEIDHTCHGPDCLESLNCPHRSCVRPDHLATSTPRANTLRGNTISGANARKTHCPQGHPYDEVNTYVQPKTGKRSCRACKLARQTTPEGRAYFRGWYARNRKAS